MRFNLQMFGGGKGGQVSTYEPSDEQRALWRIQLQTAENRQPHEIYLNQKGKEYFDEVINMLNDYGAYGSLSDPNNFMARGDLAISQVDNAMRKLIRVADWNKEYESDGVTQASWQTETLVAGRNSTAAKDLQIALRGTGDKIVRFADRTRHQLFLEPEGRHTNEYYLNGFSSSLPEEIQAAE